MAATRPRRLRLVHDAGATKPRASAAPETHMRSAHEGAIDGLRAIAQLEEYVAAEIDEPGYYGEVAARLRRSAARRREAARILQDWPPTLVPAP